MASHKPKEIQENQRVCSRVKETKARTSHFTSSKLKDPFRAFRLPSSGPRSFQQEPSGPATIVAVPDEGGKNQNLEPMVFPDVPRVVHWALPHRPWHAARSGD